MLYVNVNNHKVQLTSVNIKICSSCVFYDSSEQESRCGTP